jgi:3-deoxy-manno-octulosonate cytidylyltransferase (CMP-KDO synthetase)
MKTRVLAIIPARFNSRRFPGKPLARIAGRSVLEHIFAEVSRSSLIDDAVVATDSDEIYNATLNFGGAAIMTSTKPRTGSDRSAEAMKKLRGDIIISAQADHVGLKTSDYNRVIKAMLLDSRVEFATIVKKIDDEDILFDPNRVKVIFGRDKYALWFSRYPLPFLKGVKTDWLSRFRFYYHVGVYFFRRKALMEYARWPQTPHEKAESLEQLRILENRRRIKVFETKSDIISIDAPQDLAGAEKRFSVI